MDEAIVKEEIIEEEFNFTFKNGEFVEVKQEETEHKPEYQLENEVKTETNDDFFENNNSDGFFEVVKLKPKEIDSKFEKMPTEITEYICKICRKRMPRKLLKLIKSEDDKTMLSQFFKIEGSLEPRLSYVCSSHIREIMDGKDGKLKKAKESRRRACNVCHTTEDYPQLYKLSSKDIRIVIMIGCILRGTHSIDKAMDYVMANDTVITCYSHRKESIDIIFEHLGINNIQQFFLCSRLSMNGLVDIANNIDSDFTVDQFSRAFHSLYIKKPKNVPSNL
ncbi:hypothetical protein B9Z55_021067 [Caenorhabditis nigoni]|uniref:Lin-15A/B-like domain-containing protein n=1 Tax=Caenorhabditis nigoni TaxID=1611254 RepID=A0A2G5TQJ0_9PELO|nr:hypothetical protein B9Z55_021067 [Caenorhabditis nigoni]